MFTVTLHPLCLNLCVSAVAVDLLSGLAVFYSFITACRRRTRDKRVQQAQPLKIRLPRPSCVFQITLSRFSKQLVFFFTFPCLISGMSPKMSKPYGRTGGLAGGEHKSRQHGSFATCFHRLLSLFWLPLSSDTGARGAAVVVFRKLPMFFIHSDLQSPRDVRVSLEE